MGAAGLSAFRTVSPMRAAAGLSATRMASPMRAAAGLTATRMMGAPQGVDLDLGQFDLSCLNEVATGEVNYQQNVDVSKVFWSSIDDEVNNVFAEDDVRLLRAVFNSALSDR